MSIKKKFIVLLAMVVSLVTIGSPNPPKVKEEIYKTPQEILKEVDQVIKTAQKIKTRIQKSEEKRETKQRR